MKPTSTHTPSPDEIAPAARDAPGAERDTFAELRRTRCIPGCRTCGGTGWHTEGLRFTRCSLCWSPHNAVATAVAHESQSRKMNDALPRDAAARKAIPLHSGLLRYFPLALAEVARLSAIGNEQHNPGQPLHWDRAKSTDELDALARHLLEAGTLDSDGVPHSAKLAWRALANLQKELENAE